MTWSRAASQLETRLHVFAATDPRLADVQRRRAAIYLSDGAVKTSDLTDDGRWVMDEDAGALHFVLDDPPTGGIWWRVSERPDYAWGGGWWTSVGSQRRDGSLLILILIAQSLEAGCRYGWSTVTRRHNAHHILYKCGATPVHRWLEPDYGCVMEWVQFDLAETPDVYRPTIDAVRAVLARLKVG